MFLNILVGLDASASARRALEHAVDLARGSNAKLTLITVAPPTSTYVTLAGVERRHDDRRARQVGERRPPGGAAHASGRRDRAHRAGARPAGPKILEELNRGGYDLIVLGSRGRGRAQEGLLGSVNGYVHFHAKVPLLSVPPHEGDED